MQFSIEAGPAPGFRHPHSGPYDRQLGLSDIDEYVSRLEAADFTIESQARVSEQMAQAIDWGLFPVYDEKPSAGLRITDRHGDVLHSVRRPERLYADFASIPDLVVHSLLFIENREALDSRYPYKNPAVEWDRLANAVFGLALANLGVSPDASGGGSTLATQIEKLRHSPGGRTSGVGDKLRQMVSASLRSYAGGRNTAAARRRIVTDYLNSLPLAAIPGYGEVHGLGDGLWAWFGADFDEVNRALENPAAVNGDTARAYREVLSLLLATNKPTAYLVRERRSLGKRVDGYLMLLADAGVISPVLRDRALAASTDYRNRAYLARRTSFAERKATDSVRIELLETLGIDSAYSLDRLDLGVESTLDAGAQHIVSEFLGMLRDTDFAARAGLRQHRLLATGDPAGVIYSVTLYERLKGRNLLRVQADNLDQPLNISEGTKLELGSTAKLRTLASYLLAISRLHAELAPLSPEERAARPVAPADHLTQWAVEWLDLHEGSLAEMLDAAMERRYSASPAEAFFTGGGLLRFSNFEPEDNHRILTVREAFRRSVNLVFVRLMRDLVDHWTYRLDGVTPDILADSHNPARRQYLDRFAEREGRQYLAGFYRKHEGLKADESLALVAGEIHATPRRLAALYRFAKPWDGVDGLAAFVIGHLLDPDLSDDLFRDLYREFGPDRFSLNDRAYIVGCHPLELWLLEYKARHPDADLSSVLDAARPQYQTAYEWLFRDRARRAQDRAIRVMLEVDTFRALHKEWRRMGYPFDHLVPSLATALGSSGDTPAALADLVGIIANDGVYYPSVRIERLHFASETPFETNLVYGQRDHERVMPAEIATLLKRELVGVVEHGTAQRANRAILTGDGQQVAVGGKTGTGDNRFEVYGPGGQVIESRVINRTATFIFLVGDRYFGTVTAFVPGEAAANYEFTSSLPVQIFRDLSPALEALLEDEPPPPLSAEMMERPLPAAPQTPAKPPETQPPDKAPVAPPDDLVASVAP